MPDASTGRRAGRRRHRAGAQFVEPVGPVHQHRHFGAALQRFLQPELLAAAGLHEFDAWAAAFGETRTELELQPSGRYKPVTRFAEFVNVPELVAMKRQFLLEIYTECILNIVKIEDGELLWLI